MNNIQKEQEKRELERRATLKQDLLKITNGSLVLTSKNVAYILNKSVVSVMRDARNAKGPSFISESKNNLMFPVEDMLDYLTNTIKTYN